MDGSKKDNWRFSSQWKVSSEITIFCYFRSQKFLLCDQWNYLGSASQKKEGRKRFFLLCFLLFHKKSLWNKLDFWEAAKRISSSLITVKKTLHFFFRGFFGFWNFFSIFLWVFFLAFQHKQSWIWLVSNWFQFEMTKRVC